MQNKAKEMGKAKLNTTKAELKTRWEQPAPEGVSPALELIEFNLHVIFITKGATMGGILPRMVTIPKLNIDTKF